MKNNQCLTYSQVMLFCQGTLPRVEDAFSAASPLSDDIPTDSVYPSQHNRVPLYMHQVVSTLMIDLIVLQGDWDSMLSLGYEDNTGHGLGFLLHSHEEKSVAA